jgi:Zn-dependent protease
VPQAFDGETLKFWSVLHRQFQVARVYGIPVRIDARWFVVFALSVWMISANLQSAPVQLSQMRVPALHAGTAWALALITTAALFLSIFGHELSHALVGRAEGIEIEEIVLHPFGGLARLKTEPHSPGAEFRIAIAGPAASFIFSLLGLAAAVVANLGRYPTAVVLFAFIGLGNLLLAVFNLFPGYPLDGGRVLRALLWHSSGDVRDATRKAGLCGLVIAIFLIIFGVFVFTAWQSPLMGLWSLVIGLFLLDAAARVVKSAARTSELTVSQVMGVPVSIEPAITISYFVDNILPMHPQTSFPVASQGQLFGMLSLQDLKSVPRERWRELHARDVMRPVGPQLFVGQDTAMSEAKLLMKDNGVGALAVVNGNGKLVGFLQNGKVRRKN